MIPPHLSSRLSLRHACLTTALSLALALTSAASVAQEPASPAPAVLWSASDITGSTVQVPDANRPTVLLFLMADQDRSDEAAKQLLRVLQAGQDLQVIAVVSGENAQLAAATLAEKTGWTAPIVVDMDHAASGSMSVYAWPTTLVLHRDGSPVAHIAGLPDTFNKDMAAYLDFVRAVIDKPTLDQRLASYTVLATSDEQLAAGHLQVAERLLDRGQPQLAKKELEKAINLTGDNPRLQVTMARVDLRLGDPETALALLDALPKGTLASWQVDSLRGEALVLLGEWEQAQQVLLDALKLNPRPAQVYYFLGRVYEHSLQWQKAAESYRAAFERSPLGRDLTSD
jgi:tetratricopeptide (TPR) repeat protein